MPPEPYFNPRTPCGVRRRGRCSPTARGDFNPRTPCGVRPECTPEPPFWFYFNPRTPCGVRLTCLELTTVWNISISIHAPLAGCDIYCHHYSSLSIIFQSTHPLRGATRIRAGRHGLFRFQSTHPLRGATDDVLYEPSKPDCDFNPRTPCGVRQERSSGRILVKSFQSTHPLRGATSRQSVLLKAQRGISIHAPLAGCDSNSGKTAPSESRFQSTHPLRGATRKRCGCHETDRISIHAPLAGCDMRRYAWDKGQH